MVLITMNILADILHYITNQLDDKLSVLFITLLTNWMTNYQYS